MTVTTEPLVPLDPAQPTYGYQPVDLSAAPAVSVITPYYNTGALLIETARSLFRQSLQNWEWIIVNDGSTEDKALRALLPFRSADARIRVIDQPNRGLPAARNAGAAHARAELLFFLDSDDLLAPTALEKLAWSLVSRPASAMATAWRCHFGAQNRAWPRGFDTRYAFLYENMASPQTMIRRAVFDEIGGFDEARRSGMEDYEFWLRCAAHGFWGHDLHEFLIWVRTKPAEAYTSYRWSFQDDAGAVQAFNREMRKRYPKLFLNGLPKVGRSGDAFDPHTLIATQQPFTNLLDSGNSNRRILLLLPWIQMGGADRFALDLASGLIARGDRVSVGLLRDQPNSWMNELLRVTSDVFHLPSVVRPADFPRFLVYLVQSRQISHVLVSNTLLAYQLLPFLRVHCPNVAFVDYLHAEEEWHNGGFPQAAIEHDALFDLHIASSAHLRDWMVKRGAEQARIELCTVNIDPQRWSPNPELRASTRQALGVRDETPIVMFVGRLAPEKRPQVVIEVLHRVRERAKHFVGLIVGDGENRVVVEQLIRHHRLNGQIHVLGSVSPDRARELFDAADLLLLPSAREGIALTLYEAMAMQVVPIAADVGGQHELVTSDCGVLVPTGPNDVAAYVDALERLLTDPDLRRTMAVAGRNRIVALFAATAMLDCMQESLDLASQRHAQSVQGALHASYGLAAASLAIEHYQMDARLRSFAPLRLILRLRQSIYWRPLQQLLGLRSFIEPADRVLYAARRTVADQVRALLRQIKNQDNARR